MLTLVSLMAATGCITVEIPSPDRDGGHPQEPADPSPTPEPVVDTETERLRELTRRLKAMDGVTDHGDRLTVALDANTRFRTMCEGETADLTFNGNDTRVLLTCGGYSGGFGGGKPIELVLVAGTMGREVHPYDHCEEPYAILRIAADRSSATIRCRNGMVIPDRDAERDRFLFP